MVNSRTAHNIPQIVSGFYWRDAGHLILYVHIWYAIHTNCHECLSTCLSWVNYLRFWPELSFKNLKCLYFATSLVEEIFAPLQTAFKLASSGMGSRCANKDTKDQILQHQFLVCLLTVRVRFTCRCLIWPPLHSPTWTFPPSGTRHQCNWSYSLHSKGDSDQHHLAWEAGALTRMLKTTASGSSSPL